MAQSKKNASKLNAHLLFLDESGFMLLPPVRKTWSPRGQTPFHYHWLRHDKVSAISAISVSPKRRRLSLYCRLYEQNINREDVHDFLRDLLRHIPGHLFVLLDNAQIHKGGPIVTLLARSSRLHLVPLPPYAPELNPDEGIWRHLKHALANTRPDNTDDLMNMLSEDLLRLSRSPSLLRGCIHQSDLPPFLP